LEYGDIAGLAEYIAVVILIQVNIATGDGVQARDHTLAGKAEGEAGARSVQSIRAAIHAEGEQAATLYPCVAQHISMALLIIRVGMAIFGMSGTGSTEGFVDVESGSLMQRESVDSWAVVL